MGRTSKRTRKSEPSGGPEKKKTAARKTSKKETEETSDDFLYKLLQSLHDILTTHDTKTLQTALHELSDSHKKSPVLSSVVPETASSTSRSSHSHPSPDSAAPEETECITINQSIGYWVVLASHTLQRLLTLYNDTSSNRDEDMDDSIMVIMAWMSYFLSAILNPAKTERFTSGSTPGSRQIYGRALLVSTAAATQALKALTVIPTEDASPPAAAKSKSSKKEQQQEQPYQPPQFRTSIKDPCFAHALQVAVLALDNVVYLNHNNPITGTAFPLVFPPSTVMGPSQQVSVLWTEFRKHTQQHLEKIVDWSTDESDIAEVAAAVTTDWAKEAACLHAVIQSQPKTSDNDDDSDTSPTDSKRKKLRRKREASSSIPSDGDDSDQISALNQKFQQLLSLSPQSEIKLDGRLAIKRWTAVALCWYCNGHTLLLQAALAILLRPEDQDDDSMPVAAMAKNSKYKAWKDYMDVEQIIGPAAVRDITSSEADDSEGQKPAAVEIPSSDIKTDILPGNITALWLVGRLIRIVREIGNLAGNKPPPSGGYDNYMRAVFGTVVPNTSTSPSPPSKKRHRSKLKGGIMPVSTKSAFSSTRSDIRDLATVLVYHLIQAHYETLRCNVPMGQRRLVVNDSPDLGIVKSPNDNLLATKVFGSESISYFCYPFVHKAIDELARSSASAAAVVLSANVHTGSGTSHGGVLSGLGVLGASNNGISLSDQTRWSDRIEHVAAAYILQAQTTLFKDTAIDARLTHFSVMKLTPVLQIASSNNNNTSDCEGESPRRDADSPTNSLSISDANPPMSMVAQVVKRMFDEYKLEDELPTPSLQSLKAYPPSTTIASAGTKRRRKSGAADSPGTHTTQCKMNPCTFAGIFLPSKQTKRTGQSTTSGSNRHHDSDTFSNEEKLCLLLRAVTAEESPAKEENDKTKQLFSSLASHLISVAEGCCDTRDSVAAEPHESSTVKKRKSDANSSTRANKRRRKSAGNKKDEDVSSCKEENDIVAQNDEALTRPIRGVRNSLVSEILDSIQMIFRVSNTSTLSLRPTTPSSFREYIDIDVLNRIIDLSSIIENIVGHDNPAPSSAPLPQESTVKDENNSKEKSQKEGSSALFETPNSTFSHEEKCLWASHMNACIVVGRGHTSFSDNPTGILGDNRLGVYKRIARSAFLRNASEGTYSEEDKRWPLWLPPAHRLIIAANLTAEVNCQSFNNFNGDPDRLIVGGVIRELEIVFERIVNLVPFITITRAGANMPSVCEEVPLSLHDSRIFLLALSRLPSTEQESSFRFLLEAIETCIMRVKEKGIDVICDYNKDVPSFMARLITLCVNAFIMIKYRSTTKSELVRVVGKSLSSQLPTFRSRTDWYFAEKCFMGVFHDWEDSELPNIVLAPESCDNMEEKRLERILEVALSMGFATSKVDKCHLLFAAWNAIGKRDLWIEKTVKLEEETCLPTELSVLLLQLRDEICLVQRLIRRAKRVPPSNYFLRRIEERETFLQIKPPRAYATEVKEHLASMVKKASSLIDKIIAEYVPDDESMEQFIPSEAFCLLEGLAIYVSFAISAHTEQKNDFFSSTLMMMAGRTKPRDRAYSTDSENVASEVGSVDTNDALVDTLERLQDVCEALGAVPSHPDWLDSENTLWDGISYKEAAATAEVALKSLTKLISVSLLQSRVSLNRALEECNQSATESPNVALASDLCVLQNFETENSVFGEGPYTKGDRSLSKDIGVLCNMESEFLDVILSETAGRHRHAARGRWCPHAAQRILGRFQDLFRSQIVSEVESPELRSGGEWEVLLSGTLASTAVHVDASLRSESIANEAYEALARAEKWLIVSWAALDSMVPTSALLRYGLCSGGRKKHPLSSADTSIETYESIKAILVDEFSVEIDAPNRVKELIRNSLAVIARFPPSPTCEAIATHLMINGDSFASLQGMEVSTKAIQILSDVQEFSDSCKSEAFEAIPYLVERVAAVLELYGGIAGETDNESHEFKHVFACLRPKGSIKIDTLVAQNEDLTSVLLQAGSSGMSSYKRSWETPNEKFVSNLVSYIWRDCAYTNPRTRLFFIRAITSLAAFECDKTNENLNFLNTIIESFNRAPEAKIVDLVNYDICPGTSEPNQACNEGANTEQASLDLCCEMRETLCALFSFLLACQGKVTKFGQVALVLTTLENSYSQWKHVASTERRHILWLLTLYGCQMKKLGLISEKFIEDVRIQSSISDKHGLENLSDFFDFVLELRLVLSKRSLGSGGPESSKSNKLEIDLPHTCSFASKSDFHEQHWYNCYTCDLTADKGCCTLCALVCHHGHDVSYSRFSSFFCDCGAPYKTPTGKNRTACQCLTSQPRDQLYRKILSIEQSKKYDDGKKGSRLKQILTLRSCANIVKFSFPQEGQRAINDLVDYCRQSQWFHLLFECAKNNFILWNAQKGLENPSFQEDISLEDYQSKRSSLLSRSSGVVNPRELVEEDFSYLGSSQSGCFQMKILSDGVSDRVKRNFLSTKGVSRQVLGSDSRGRVVIAETGSLFFCSLLPIVNRRSATCDDTASIQRSSMCILGTVANDFGVVGLKFSKDYERHLLVWGTEDAKVLHLNDRLSAAVTTSSLEIIAGGTGDTGNEYVTNCCWLRGARGLVAVCTSRSVRIFDLSRPGGDAERARPVKIISNGSCELFRDFVVIPLERAGEDCEDGQSWSIYVLLGNGKIHNIALVRNPSNGLFSAKDNESPPNFDSSDLQLDKSRSISLAKEGSSKSRSRDDSFFSKLSFGRETRLDFLEQSRILIYQSDASYAYALPLSIKGRINGSFALLPHEIQADVLNKKEKHCVVGPYTHWQGLGLVSDGKETFFRSVCCGKNSVSGSSVLLCIHFNEKETKIQELKGISIGVNLDSSASLEGVTAITCPFAADNEDECNLESPRLFVEKVVFCTLLTNGSLHLYLEQTSTPCKALSIVSNGSQSKSIKEKNKCSPKKDIFIPLLAFENLTSVSDVSNFVIEGDGLGSPASIREKLLGDSELFLMNPRRDSFTLTVSRGKVDEIAPASSFNGDSAVPAPKALVGIRILVGGRSFDCIPKILSVQGRIVEPKKGVKKWYSFLLTAQEIAQSIRNGFVTIEIGQAHDISSNPIVDAIELYELNRSKIDDWLPSTLESLVSSERRNESEASKVTANINAVTDSFRLSLMALRQLINMIGSFEASKEENMFLKQLVRDTALLREKTIDNAVRKLVESFHRDEDARQSFLDKAILSGCANFLQQCQHRLDAVADQAFDDKFLKLWKSFVPSLRTCLQTSANIARHRAYNYLQAADETPLALGSIATDASKFMVGCFTRSSTVDLVSDFVELSLLETAVTVGSRSTSEYSPRGQIGSFDGLRSLLESPNVSVVSEACASISNFCERYSVAKRLEDDEVDLFTAQTMEVKYACDSCTNFINDVRYTLLDDDHPFDLCPTCYNLAKNCSTANDKGPDCSVMVNGKPVGEDPQLTCGEVDMMKAVEIKKSIVLDDKHVREALAGKRNVADDGDTTVAPDREVVGIKQRQQLFDDFMDGLFTGIAGLLENELCKDNGTPASLIWLSVDLIRHSVQSKRRLDRSKRLAKAMAIGLMWRLNRINSLVEGTHESDQLRTSIVIFIEGLINLIVPDRAARKYLTGQCQDHIVDHDEKSPSNVICKAHQISASLREFSSGENKGRKFFTCSLKESNRCNFFAWADDPLTKGSKNECPESLFSTDVADFIGILFATPLHEGKESLRTSLRDLIDGSTNTDAKSEGEMALRKTSHSTLMPYDFPGNADVSDGVFCSRCRLQNVTPEDVSMQMRCLSQSCLPGSESSGRGQIVVHKSLELLALVAAPEAADRFQWFPILCKIMLFGCDGLDEKESHVQSLARICVKQFCGNKTDFSLAICDHYTFGFRMTELVRHTEAILNYIVILNEKARQCGIQWRTSKPVKWGDLKISDLIGVEDLVSEDVATIHANQIASNILNEMLIVAGKRIANWRRFCGMRSIQLCKSTGGLDVSLSSPPVFVLLALASALDNENQFKTLKLLSLALSTPNDRRQDRTDENSNVDFDGRKSDVPSSIEDPFSFLGVKCSTPDVILRSSVDDIHSFVLRFVCRGWSSEIRSCAASVAAKLCQHTSKAELGTLFKRLMGMPLSEIGIMGKRYTEFLSFLQRLLKLAGYPSVDVGSAARRIEELLRQQILAIRHDRANGEFLHFETRSTNSIQKKRYDLASCVNCRLHTNKTKEKHGERSTSPSDADRGLSSATRLRPPSISRAKWLPEQVCAFSRGRLDSSRDSCTSNEFCSFFSLKHRFAVSGVHLEVNDPRGRYVKTINIYFSPRPVKDPVVLKSNDFASNWQLCGQINLARGSSRATCTLTVKGETTPVVAANLKIEYADFYERPGSSRSSDGTIVVHCPRCTRVVTNAHGVCGNCGEVAFQCRKCRHINYDGLDAFLCVECGYCSSGTFLYELTAGVASNAIAITNDNDYNNLTEMKSVAARLQEDLRATLQAKLVALLRGKKKSNASGESDDVLESSSLKRAFSGSLALGPGDTPDDKNHQLALSQIGKPGSVIKIIARPDSHGGDRTRSLFRVSRQSRTENSSSRRSGDGLMIRHLGRNLDDDESASELFGGLLEGSGNLSRIAVLDPSDPLSRLLASVQSRRERREAEEREQRRDNSTARPSAQPAQSRKSVHAKEALEECERLHQLMREAEREFYELDRRCKAWCRLESGALGVTGADEDLASVPKFDPSHCSACAGTVALQLVILWLRVFQLSPDSVSISKDLIALLLNDDATQHLKNLQDTKRTVVKEIALHSKQGNPLVLDALRLRLAAFHDTNSAEIVGKILKAANENEEAAKPFAALATQVLESNEYY